jgi:hypothetical protein
MQENVRKGFYSIKTYLLSMLVSRKPFVTVSLKLTRKQYEALSAKKKMFPRKTWEEYVLGLARIDINE